MSVLKGDVYMVKSVSIYQPKIYLKVLEDESVNWDIVVPSEDQEGDLRDEPGSGENSSFNVILKHLEINNASIKYEDNYSSTYIYANQLDHKLSGDLSADFTTLSTKTSIEDFTLFYGNIEYFKNTTINLKADLDADLVKNKYTFKENELYLNRVFLGFDGFAEILDNNLLLDLKLNTKKTEFKDLLSLIPAVYMKDFQEIQTDGIFTIECFARGIFEDDILPEFGIDLKVENGFLSYPDLPSSISNISLTSKVYNPGGLPDLTTISVSSMHYEIADNPINMNLEVKTPVSDPHIDLKFNGSIDLESIDQLYPFEGITGLNGDVIADFLINGRMSAFESGDIDHIKAEGFIEINDLNYQAEDSPVAYQIIKSRMEINPGYIDLLSFDSRIGESDFGAKGKIENYIPYLVKGSTVTGKFATLSKYMNLNEILIEENDEATVDKEAQVIKDDTITSEMSAIIIPPNIDFFLTSSFGRLVYSNLDMNNVKGRILVKHSELLLEDLKMSTLGGRLVVNGTYDTKNVDNPEIDLVVDLEAFDVQQSYNAFALLQEYTPVLKRTDGSYSSGISIKTALDKKMRPVFSSFNSRGNLFSSNIVIEDIQVLNRVVDILKIDPFKNATIDELNLDFEFVNGALNVEPFNFNIGNVTANLGGTTALDKGINYILSLKIPKEMLGSSFNQVYQSLLGETGNVLSDIDLLKFLELDVIIGGTLSDPTIKTGLKDSMEDMVEALKNKAKEELEKKKQEAEEKLKEEAEKYIAQAQVQANQILSEARKRADEIRNLAQQAADRIRYEADTNASRLIEEGKKKGMLAEMAAKTAADGLKKEADKQANNVIREAENNAQAILQKAQDESDAIIEEAKNKFK
jgi:hypothetical protein